MTEQPPSDLCPDDRLEPLIHLAGENDPVAVRRLADLIDAYPDDPRLHFLAGSLAAARQDYAAAEAAMRRAIAIAPDYAIARFQLGLLLLTNGQGHAAQEVWGPLHGLAPDDPLRVFASGLIHLIYDRFRDAVDQLERGIGLNIENEAMNNDMRLIIEEARQKRDDDSLDGDSPLSSAELLLQQAAMRATRH